MGAVTRSGREVERLCDISDELKKLIYPFDTAHPNYGYVRCMGVRMHGNVARIEVDLERKIPQNISHRFPTHFMGEEITYK